MLSGFARGWEKAAVVLLGCVALGTSGCNRLINGPASAHDVVQRPTEIMNFEVLYNQNCSACHGANGMNGPAVGFNNPIYMAVASNQVMANYTANGGPGELMPAFARSAGGLLTDDQINAIVGGMRQRWAKPAMLTGVSLPPYAASHPGDAAAGGQVYAQACARCHGQAGAAGTQGSPGESGAITNPVYLSLISDQGLRTIVIAGRPELKMPDFRNDIAGHPLSDAQITDVVAWLSSRRPALPVTHPGSNLQPDALMHQEPQGPAAESTPTGLGSPLTKRGVQAMPALHPRPHTPAQPAQQARPAGKPTGGAANEPQRRTEPS